MNDFPPIVMRVDKAVCLMLENVVGPDDDEDEDDEESDVAVPAAQEMV